MSNCQIKFPIKFSSHTAAYTHTPMNTHIIVQIMFFVAITCVSVKSTISKYP